MTETLEVIPRQWKVVQTVRERFACRACEAVIQPPAPFHATPRGLFGPSFLAMVMFESEPSSAIGPSRWRAGTHQPLNRQRDLRRACAQHSARRVEQVSDPTGTAHYTRLRHRTSGKRKVCGRADRHATGDRGAARRRSGAVAAVPARSTRPPQSGRGRDRLYAQGLGRVQPVPGRRPYLRDQQCRRTRPARCGSRQEGMAVCRFGSRRRARRVHVHPDRHRQAQRHRPTGMARRRPRTHRRRLPEPAARLLPWNWRRDASVLPLAA